MIIGLHLGLALAAAVPEAPSGVGGTPATNGVVLQAMDKLHYRIPEDPSKNGELLLLSVPASQMVEFPVSLGYPQRVVISVKGRTLDEVLQELKSKLDQDYYVNSHPDLKLVDRAQKGGRVMIYGAVRQFSIDLPPGEQKTILEAVLQAVTSEFAKLSKVKLHRLNPNTGKVDSRVVDVEAIKKSGDRSKDVVLQDGDRIEVPERGIVF